jgi:hypothetical protein
MRSKEVILNEIKISLESKYKNKQVSGVLVPLQYIDCLKLEYICNEEKTTSQEIISKLLYEKIKKFDLIFGDDYDNKRS